MSSMVQVLKAVAGHPVVRKAGEAALGALAAEVTKRLAAK